MIDSKAYDLTKCKGTQECLIRLRDTYGLTWAEILEFPEYAPIPLPTLSMIFHGKRGVPKKFREQLGEPITAPAAVCSACGGVNVIDRACELRVTVKRKPTAPKQAKRYPRFYAWIAEQLTIANDWS